MGFRNFLRKNSSKELNFQFENGLITEQTIKVWLSLPKEIREDSVLGSFKTEYDRLKGFPNENCDLLNRDVKLEENEEGPFSDLLHTSSGASNEREGNQNTNKKSLLRKFAQYFQIKILCLCLVWLVCTLILARKSEKILEFKQIAIPESGTWKVLTISQYSAESKIMLSMEGPFNPNFDDNSNKTFLYVSLENEIKNLLDQWKIPLNIPSELESFELKKIKKMFNFENTGKTLMLKFNSNLNEVLSINISYDLSPIDENIGLIYGAAILIILYVLIIFELVNRTFGAIIASFCGISALAFLNDRPTMGEIIVWMDMESLMLLFSMMVLVVILTETGVFDVIAVKIFKITDGQTWPLIYNLCLASAVFSSVVDNVTVILLMTPLTIRLCEVVNLNPKPVLMAVVLFTNIGGTITPIGGPPNIMITSNPSVAKQGVSFINFSLHMGIGAIFVMIQTACQFRFIFRDVRHLTIQDTKEVLQIRREIRAWKKAMHLLLDYPKGSAVVKKILKSKIKSMQQQLKKIQISEPISRDMHKTTLNELENTVFLLYHRMILRSSNSNKKNVLNLYEDHILKWNAMSSSSNILCDSLFLCRGERDKLRWFLYKIKNVSLLVKSGFVFGLVMILFFIQSIPHLKSMSPGWCALIGVILLLIISEKDDMDEIMHRIEWTTLIFFAAMFITMECIARLGLVNWIGKQTENVILSVHQDARLALAIVLIIWISAISSSFVDAIPITVMMLKVVIFLAENPALKLPLQPLIWALAYGPSIGGNGTLYGASANTVCAGVAAHQGYKIKFLEYMRVCYPIMVGNILIITGYLLLVHVLFQWH